MSVLTLEADIHHGDGYVSFVPQADLCLLATSHALDTLSTISAGGITAGRG
jgi:hypothetical protein